MTAPVAIVEALATVGLRPAGEAYPVATGWESAIWGCDTAGGPVAVRVYAPGIPADAAAAEAVTMRRLEIAGYPAPLVFHFEPDPSLLGAPFLVMDLLAGGDLWSAGWGPERVGTELASLMVELHRLPIDGFDPVPTDPLAWVTAAGGRVREMFPGFGRVLDWVTERLAGVVASTVPCHRDLHPGNVVLDEDGECWVIDWTAFRLTDPRVDSSWTRLLGEMYAPELLPSFVEGLRRLGEDETDVAPFEVMAAIRRLTDFLLATSGDDVDWVQNAAEIAAHAPSMRVPARWISDRTGLYVPEVEAALDVAGA